MTLVQKQLEEISNTSYPLTREADFEAFWKNASDKVEKHDPRLEMKEVKDSPYKYLKIYDLTQYALDGTPLKAWLYLPAEASETNKVPGAIFFHGGNGSRGTSTSKKKQQQYKASGEKKQPGTNENGRVGNRPYARGRAYSEDHYAD